ncbi:MAG: exodeoxyribonuclease III [Alphaproteobacteria bacterium]|nr:exodeoxyribonuclease III [Alphaproteobacteria bacterium]
MKIATWNVNSIKARLANVTHWLEQGRPDIVLLQEIKCQSPDFPVLDFKALGYHVETVGQKTYNGVAILSRAPIADLVTRLPGDETDEQARYIEATIGNLRVASIYLPNGNPVESDKYPYKLRWMERLRRHAATLLARERPLVLAGDYNVIPTDADVYDPEGWRADALCRTETRAAFRRIVHLGLTDAFRALDDRAGQYSFWDYQAGRWPRDEGLRIDHLLLSPQAADRLVATGIDRDPRGREKASDHTPVWCELSG